MFLTTFAALVLDSLVFLVFEVLDPNRKGTGLPKTKIPAREAQLQDRTFLAAISLQILFFFECLSHSASFCSCGIGFFGFFGFGD